MYVQKAEARYPFRFARHFLDIGSEKHLREAIEIMDKFTMDVVSSQEGRFW